MIVIIEGCDLAGKSTLATQIRALNGSGIVKIRWALRGDLETVMRTMASTTINILSAAQPSVIFDRSYFSWWAFAPELGYDNSYMPDLIADFSAVLDARLILLTASEAEIRRRHALQPDHRYSLDAILGANARFPSLLPLLPNTLPSLHIDTTHTPPDAVFTQVRAFLETPPL